jgi:UDP-N-acetylglucosamine 2-epimerase (non-hydrolysing)
MIARMAAADLILSDSGGIQEEAPALGIPLLILRDLTERPEAIECGAAIMAGTDPDVIRVHATRLLDDAGERAAMAVPRFPFGRGDASEKIVTVIENYLRSQNVT